MCHRRDTNKHCFFVSLALSLSGSSSANVSNANTYVHTHTHTNIDDTDRLSQSTLSLCSRSSVLVRLSLSWAYLLFCSSVGFHVAPFVKTNLNLLYAQTCVCVCVIVQGASGLFSHIVKLFLSMYVNKFSYLSKSYRSLGRS